MGGRYESSSKRFTINMKDLSVFTTSDGCRIAYRFDGSSTSPRDADRCSGFTRCKIPEKEEASVFREDDVRLYEIAKSVEIDTPNAEE